MRTCNNRLCFRSSWNRDVNAAINVMLFLVRELRGEEVPPAFRRGGDGAPEDPMLEPDPGGEAAPGAAAAASVPAGGARPPSRR
jgi:hypothetical protein